MHFAIDYDSRSVESKSENQQELIDYIESNNLDLVVALISSEDDLVLNLSLGEMQDLYTNLEPNSKITKDSEELAAKLCWELLEELQDDFPTYTKALGKKLIKQANSESKASKETKPKAKSKSTGTRLTAKFMQGKIFTNTDKRAKAGAVMSIIQNCIEENMGEATFEEIQEDFMFQRDCDEKYANGYIAGSVREGFTEIKSEDL